MVGRLFQTSLAMGRLSPFGRPSVHEKWRGNRIHFYFTDQRKDNCLMARRPSHFLTIWLSFVVILGEAKHRLERIRSQDAESNENC